MTPPKPPARLKPPWTRVWRDAQKRLEEHGAWSVGVSPLLDEYVAALMCAKQLRDAGEGASPAVNREVRRALSLAAMLGLTPRRAVGRPPKEKEPDGTSSDQFAELDELAPRRNQRARRR